MQASVVFTPDPRLVLNALNKIQQKVLLGAELIEAVSRAQEGIEFDAKTYLQVSKRDPAATQAGDGSHVNQIMSNISSGVKRSHRLIGGWTGDIKQLDSYVTNNSVPLWRILETGAKKHLIVSWDTSSSVGNLRFYWYRRGYWVSTLSVNHPGMVGRKYFAKAIEGAPMWYDKHVRPVYFRIFHGNR